MGWSKFDAVSGNLAKALVVVFVVVLVLRGFLGSTPEADATLTLGMIGVIFLDCMVRIFSRPDAVDDRETGHERVQGLELDRSDGAKISVDAMHCGTCRNYFWAALAEIERPSFCPYCGVRFESVRLIDSDESNRLQDDG